MAHVRFLCSVLLLALCWREGSTLAQPPEISLSSDASFSRHFQHGTGPRVANVELLKQIDNAILVAIDAGDFPGCVVEVGVGGEIIYQAVVGHRSVEPRLEPMTVETIFDLASLTKPIATGSSIMLLIEQGKVSVEDRVTRFFPDFAPNGKDAVTVAHLLTHTSGLTPDNHLNDYANGPDESWKKICELPLLSPPGTKFRYSDVGFIVLGKIVEQVSGQTLDTFAFERIFEPLEMLETRYTPPMDWHPRCAPTEKINDRWQRGMVHDPRAARLEGVAGHAGLFSTLADLRRYAHMLLAHANNALSSNALSVLGQETMELFTQPREVPGGLRTFGWDARTGYSTQRGESFSDRAFGHGGFTGTVLWIDPESDLYFVFLSSRLHPDGKGSVNQLAGQIATHIGQAIQPPK